MPDDFRNSDWIELVKATRARFNVSIDEAHDLILADKDVRRLVAMRVNRELECRKIALGSIRRRGKDSPFERDGDRIRFRRI